MADGPFDPETGELTSRAPEAADLISLCRELNARDARYVVVGGLAIIEAGYPRTTGGVELLWRMKRRANRPKDQGDLQFLRMWFEARGRVPPED